MFNTNNQKKNCLFGKAREKGISVLYVVFIAGILLAIGLGISTILIQQIKMMEGIGHSVVAFYAADSGIERVLLERGGPESIEKTFLDNNSAYQVFVFGGGNENCPADFSYCIKSIGAYQKISRAIEVNY